MDLQYGIFIHEQLEKGTTPDEFDAAEFKEIYQIYSWKEYFEDLRKEIDKRINEIKSEYSECEVFLEKELCYGFLQGKIDVAIVGMKSGRKSADIIDYKVVGKAKVVEDLVTDSQPAIYTHLSSMEYGISTSDIVFHYASILKGYNKEVPLLQSGLPSKSKDNACGFRPYIRLLKRCIEKNHMDSQSVLMSYSGFLSELEKQKCVKWVDYRMTKHSVDNYIKELKMIYDFIKANNVYIRRVDSFSCKRCEYSVYCN